VISLTLKVHMVIQIRLITHCWWDFGRGCL